MNLERKLLHINRFSRVVIEVFSYGDTYYLTYYDQDFFQSIEHMNILETSYVHSLSSNEIPIEIWDSMMSVSH